MNIRKSFALLALVALVSAVPASAALFKRADAKAKNAPEAPTVVIEPEEK